MANNRHHMNSFPPLITDQEGFEEYLRPPTRQATRLTSPALRGPGFTRTSDSPSEMDPFFQTMLSGVSLTDLAS